MNGNGKTFLVMMVVLVAMVCNLIDLSCSTNLIVSADSRASPRCQHL